MPQPPSWLIGFEKVELEPGESRRVELAVTERDLSYWDAEADRWAVAPGCYQLKVGRSSRDIRADAELARGGARCGRSGGAALAGCEAESPRLIDGSARGETLLGGEGSDAIRAGGGRDTLVGRRGDDCLYGEGGRDVARGKKGADLLSGGPARDTLKGNGGDDHAKGGTAKDRIRGGGGDDDLRGNGGADTINGGAGNDRLSGSRGRDRLRPGGGADVLRGGKGNDVLRGGGGRDLLNCGAGRDRAVVSSDRSTVRNCERVIRR